MTAGNWIAIAAVVVAPLTALYVGWAQRRQMRQIEAHRLDPSVGLRPPLNPVAVVLLNHVSLSNCIVGAIAVTIQMRTQAPVTRGTVAFIAADVAVIIFGIVQDIVWSVQRNIQGILDTHLYAIRTQLETLRAHIEWTRKLSERVQLKPPEPPAP